MPQLHVLRQQTRDATNQHSETALSIVRWVRFISLTNTRRKDRARHLKQPPAYLANLGTRHHSVRRAVENKRIGMIRDEKKRGKEGIDNHAGAARVTELYMLGWKVHNISCYHNTNNISTTLFLSTSSMLSRRKPKTTQDTFYDSLQKFQSKHQQERLTTAGQQSRRVDSSMMKRSKRKPGVHYRTRVSGGDKNLWSVKRKRRARRSFKPASTSTAFLGTTFRSLCATSTWEKICCDVKIKKSREASRLGWQSNHGLC